MEYHHISPWLNRWVLVGLVLECERAFLNHQYGMNHASNALDALKTSTKRYYIRILLDLRIGSFVGLSGCNFAQCLACLHGAFLWRLTCFVDGSTCLQATFFLTNNEPIYTHINYITLHAYSDSN